MKLHCPIHGAGDHLGAAGEWVDKAGSELSMAGDSHEAALPDAWSRRPPW